MDKLLCNWKSDDDFKYVITKSDGNAVVNDVYPATGILKYKPDYFTLSGAVINGKYKFNYNTKAVLIVKKPPTSTVKGRLVARDPGNPLSDIKPVRNAQIGLMLTYYVSDENGAKTILDPYHAVNEIKKDNNSSFGGSLSGNNDSLLKALKNPFGDGNTIFAKCTTDADGNFEFKNFANADTLGVLNGYKSFGPGGPVEFNSSVHINGAISRTFRVVVIDPVKKTEYYNSSKDIVVQPQDSVDIGVLTAYNRNYNLTIIPKKAPEEKSQSEPAGVIYKCKVNLANWMGQEFGTQIVNSKSGVTFYGVKMHNKGINYDDHRITLSTSDTVGENSYQERMLRFPRVYTDWQRDTAYVNAVELKKKYKNNYNSIIWGAPDKYEAQIKDSINNVYYESAADFYFVEDYRVVNVTINAYMEPKLPIISGRVLDASNVMRGVNFGLVKLKRGTDNSNMEDADQGSRFVSDKYNHGYFVFKDLLTQEFWGTKEYKYRLNFNCPGYYLLGAKKVTSGANGSLDTSNTSAGLECIPGPNSSFALRMGQQMSFEQILMQPKGKISVRVINENGEPVDVYAKSLRGAMVSSTIYPTIWGNRSFIDLNIPTGYPDSIYVYPKDLKYFNDTVYVAPLKDKGLGITDTMLTPLVIKERRHRIKILVLDKNTNQPKPGADVELMDYKAKTDYKGEALFIFKNASMKNFWLKIDLAGSDYIPISAEIENAESKDTAKYIFTLKQGFSVKGKVTTSGRPVANAEIYVINGVNGSVKKTLSDGDGSFVLKGIRPNNTNNKSQLNADIRCVPPSEATSEDNSNLIGQEVKINFDKGENYAYEKNFDLQEFKDGNLSKLHGFKIKVHKLNQISNGSYSITGVIDLSGSNGAFETIEKTQFAAFTNLNVKPDLSAKDSKGRPYFEAAPGATSFPVQAPNLKVKLKGQSDPSRISKNIYTFASSKPTGLFDYNLLLTDVDGAGTQTLLAIQKSGISNGYLDSYARIVDNSFNFPGSYFRFNDDQFYLASKDEGTLKRKIKSFISNTDTNSLAFIKSKGANYYLTNKDGGDLSFKFLEFDAVSKVDSGLITREGVIVVKPNAWSMIKLDPQYDQTTKINIDVPETYITSQGVVCASNLKSIKIKLENWDIEASDCIINPEVGGLKSNKCVIHTGILDIPISDFNLRNDFLFIGQPTITKLPLGKVTTMSLAPGVKAQFGLDAHCGSDLAPHYKLVFSAEKVAAYINNLPGLNLLEFQAISLLSNGDQIVSFAPNCELMDLYNITKFKPLIIHAYEDNFTIDGLLNYDIPRVPNELSYKLKYEKQGSGLKLTVLPTNVNFELPGYVNFNSIANVHKQTISNNNVLLYGRISEPGKLDTISVKLSKFKTMQATQIYCGIALNNDIPEQYIKLGDKGGLFKVEAANSNASNDWGILKLKLIPSGSFSSSGFGAEPMNLAVFGEIKTDPDVKNQKIKTSGTDTEFGDFSMTFDLPNKRFIGTMNVSEKQVGNVKFAGAAEMCVDPNGFYFAAAGEADVQGFGPFSAGVLIGAYTGKGVMGGIPQPTLDLITRYSIGKGLPCALANSKSFAGFFVTGRKAIPQLSYEASVDLVIASAAVRTEAGLEASAWLNFAKPFSGGLSATVYAIAELEMGSMTCTELSAKAEGIIKGEASYEETKGFALDVCASINIMGKLEQKIPTLFGCGSTIFTLGGDKPFISLMANVKVDNSGLHPTISTGSCNKNCLNTVK